MNKFLTVLTHTFNTSLKSKTFIITTVITAILFGVVFNLPSIISLFDKNQVTQIGIIDQTENVYPMLESQAKAFDYSDIEMSLIKNEEEAKKQLNEGKISGYFIIDSQEAGSLSATYKAQQINDASITNKVTQMLNQIQFRMKAETLGLTVEQASQLFKPLALNKIPLDKNAKSEEEIVQSTVIVYILLFAIYFGVLMYGNMIATEVAKEKSTRVMEILISSVNPIQQMFGKIIGIALLGILQTLIFIFVGYISMMFGNKSVDLGDMVVDFSNIPARTIVFAVIFYILGYLLFSTIAAMLGSLVSRVEDLQQSLTPLNFVVIAAFMIAMYGLQHPDSTLIHVTSYIPFFTPMIMFLRIGISTIPTWEILLSIGIMIITILGTAVLASKIYRGGVLMYGKGNTMKNIKQAISIHSEN